MRIRSVIHAAALCLSIPVASSNVAADRGAPGDPADAPTVTLLDAGSGPRTLLRITPKKGDMQRVSITLAMDMELSLDGNDISSAKVPTMVMDAEFEVTDVTADGDIHWSVVYTNVRVTADAGVDPAVVSATRTALIGMKGAKGSGVITSRGVLRSGDLQLAAGAAPQLKQLVEGMRQSLRQMFVPWPVESVGAGARWRVEQSISQNGLTLDQVGLYTLAFDNRVAVLDATITQSAKPQKLASPMMPRGVDVELQSLVSKGHAKSRMVTSKLLPIHATASVELAMASRIIPTGGRSQDVAMKMGTRMTIAAR